jgi:diguanylate cyclase (GGDEF)-like protein/PAS domain S-box-containing protein
MSEGLLAHARALLPVGDDVGPTAFGVRHRLVLIGVWLHLPGLFVVGLVNGYPPAHLVAELAALAGLAAAAGSVRVPRPWRVALATTALVGCSAFLVHVTGGLTESHFHFFAVVAFVTLYQSWLPYLLCIGWVLLHHGVLGTLSPESVYSNPAAVARPAVWALVHGGFVVLASLAGLAAWRATELERLRAESVVAAAPHALYGVDLDGRIVFANSALAQQLGETTDRLVGRVAHDLLHPPAEHCRPCGLLASGGDHHLDQVELLDAAGQLRPHELQMRPVVERGHRVGTVVTHWDISERLSQRRQLERFALHDSLTGLANRTLLLDRLTRAMLTPRDERDRLAVFHVDLDRFKAVNAALGQTAGDALLVAIAGGLRLSARPQDTVARVGGDEFVVVAPGMPDVQAADAFAERLVAAVARTGAADGPGLLVTASVGVRLADGAVGEDAERLLADADLAMFAAKTRGGGQVVHFNAGMRLQDGSDLALGAELHRALDAGELVLHYQPVFAVADRRPVGAEALVRWQHPVHGLLGPDRFIALAEKTGMIGSLGTWVLHRAAEQLAAWRDLPGGAELTMAVNLSVRQLQDPTLVQQVADVLAWTDLPAHALCLEVTESILMRDGDGTDDMLRRLRDLGVVVAIDDFGTGYSSLSRLHGLPIQRLKIDRSFVRGLGGDDDRQQIVHAIISLAAALHLDVVAEGVETDEELTLLAELRCPHAQGFGLGRPLPADQVAAGLGIESAPDGAAAAAR